MREFRITNSVRLDHQDFACLVSDLGVVLVSCDPRALSGRYPSFLLGKEAAPAAASPVAVVAVAEMLQEMHGTRTRDRLLSPCNWNLV